MEKTYMKLKEEGIAYQKPIRSTLFGEGIVMITTNSGVRFLSKGLTEVFESAGQVPKLKDDYLEQFRKLKEEQESVLSEIKEFREHPIASIKKFNHVAQLYDKQKILYDSTTTEVFTVHAHLAELNGEHRSFVEKQKEIIQSLEKIINIF